MKTVEEWENEELLRELQRTTSYGKEKLALAKQHRPFCIVVCGVFSSGKSSLINALLGTSLPTGIMPVTRVVTKIRYGRRNRIVLKNLVSGEEREVTEYAARSIITKRQQDDSYRDCQIYIETPSEFLKDDIIIIDTPGLEDDKKEKLDAVTKQEIRKADFCIINYMSSQFGKQSEREFLREMQRLTNGNFISVLNCLNYLQQGEQQLRDLEDRARQILGEFGNERIGKGKYFRVDSQDKNDAFLDGLDIWLVDMIKKYRYVLQADTPLTMAYTELRRVKKECDIYVGKLQTFICSLREDNEESIKKQRRQDRLRRNLLHAQIAEDIIKTKDELHTVLLYSLRGKLEEMKRKYGARLYCVKAKSSIYTAGVSFAVELQNKMEGHGGRYEMADPQQKLQDAFIECIQAFTVPKPVETRVERSFFDPDRYLIGKTYSIYNDYIEETIKEITVSLFPRLGLRIERYFEEIEESILKSHSSTYRGEEGDTIQKIEQYVDKLSECSLEALEVLHAVRTERDKLIATFSV